MHFYAPWLCSLSIFLACFGLPPDNGALARGEIKLLQARFVARNDWLGEKVVTFGD